MFKTILKAQRGGGGGGDIGGGMVCPGAEILRRCSADNTDYSCFMNLIYLKTRQDLCLVWWKTIL